MEFSLCSYNCCSLNKNIDVIREITNKNIDIVFLQETFITDEKLGIVDFINENYNNISVGAHYSENNIVNVTGRPMGGLVCLWKADMPFNVKHLLSTNNFVVLELSINSFKITLVNVYLRSVLGDPVTLEQYLQTLNELEEILISYNCNNVLYAGDFNSDPFIGRTWSNFKEFLDRNDLTCFDVEFLDSDTFTHINYGSDQCRWFDHFIGRLSNGIELNNVQVLVDMIGSDHLPIVGKFLLPSASCIQDQLINTKYVENDLYIDWDNLKSEQLYDISDNAYQLQGSFRGNSVYNCVSSVCQNENCKKNIHIMYNNIVNSVEQSSVSFIKKKVKKNKYKVIPGWSRNVKKFYSIARNNYLIWLQHGKPRDGSYYNSMCSSRKIFKSKLKKCKQNKDKEISISIQNKFKDKSMKQFWKEVKNKKSKTTVSYNIDGKNDSNSILKIFSNKFLHENCDNEGEIGLISKINDRINNDNRMLNICISRCTIRKLIANLNKGIGHDGIHSNLLKNASDNFIDNIVVFFNFCYRHCYLPADLLRGNITPIIKNKRKDTCSSSNYRPIMISSNILKLIEQHILIFLNDKIKINNLQFGYIENMSTTDACMLLKEVVHKNLGKKSKVFCKFIDLSSAFDMVDHFLLADKLIESNIPIDLVLILCSYLRNQTARIFWNDTVSPYKIINTGVRQGGILSPFLFNFYINHIINEISSLQVGCKLGLSRINIIAYADDMVLMANSENDINGLYTKFKILIANHNLKINEIKSKCLIFRKSKIVPDCICNKIVLGIVDEYNYLGHILQYNLDDTKDIYLKLNNFYSSFNNTYRNFSMVDFDTFLYLFNSYCAPIYGLHLWNCTNVFNKSIFKTFNVAYSNSLKKS